MKKVSVAENLGTLLSGQDIQLFDQPFAENQKKLMDKDSFFGRVAKKKMLKRASIDGLGESPTNSSYSGIVDAFRDNKPSQSTEGFTGNFEGRSNVHKKLRKKSINK